MTGQPYGSWSSPITAELVVASAVALGEAVVGELDVWWSEGRPEEGGPGRSSSATAPAARPSTSCPRGFAARTRVHEYGGGAWWLHGGDVIFANWADQRLWRLDGGRRRTRCRSPPSRPSRPATATPTAASPPTAAGWSCVRERHPGDGGEPRNELVALPSRPDGDPVEPTVLVSGPDFVAAPRISPDGRLLCWFQWSHPDMPWDATELWVAPIGDGADQHEALAVGPAVRLLGGADESVTEPRWAPGGSLLAISDRSDWWNLYRFAPEQLAAALADPAASPPEPEAVAPHGGRGRRAPLGLRPVPLRRPRGRPHPVRLLPRRPRPPGGGPRGRCRGGAALHAVHVAVLAAGLRRRRGGDRGLADPRGGRRGARRARRPPRRRRGRPRRAAAGAGPGHRRELVLGARADPVPHHRRPLRPRPLLPADEPRRRGARRGLAAAGRAEPRWPHVGRPAPAQPGPAVLDLPGLRRGGRELRRAPPASAAATGGGSTASGGSSTSTTASPPPATSSTGATPTGTGWSSGAAAPAGSPPWRRSPSARSSRPAPASTASPTSRPSPGTPTSSRPATSTGWWGPTRSVGTSTRSARRSTTSVCSTAPSSSCRAWRTRSSRRTRPR